ncbi:MAG: hypothetical protein IJL43_00555 [Lachnospiraceae bacterium]|nr:hypothetical protein [Lachnospiraceae bacterium]
MKIKTSDGFVCEVNEEALGDWELVEKLIEVDKGNPAVLPDVMKDMFGEDGYQAAKEHVRTEKGRVPTAKLSALFFEILGKAKEASEDKKK